MNPNDPKSLITSITSTAKFDDFQNYDKLLKFDHPKLRKLVVVDPPVSA